MFDENDPEYRMPVIVKTEKFKSMTIMNIVEMLHRIPDDGLVYCNIGMTKPIPAGVLLEKLRNATKNMNIMGTTVVSIEGSVLTSIDYYGSKETGELYYVVLSKCPDNDNDNITDVLIETTNGLTVGELREALAGIPDKATITVQPNDRAAFIPACVYGTTIKDSIKAVLITEDAKCVNLGTIISQGE